MTDEHAWPGVSYVMPVLNEERYLAGAVATVMAQDYPGERELVLALGPSTDGTDAVAERLAAEDARIRLVPNPGMDIPIGLNLAIAASRHDVVVRVDAHTQIPADYTRLAVRALETSSAANVGGLMLATGDTPLQRAVARGYRSRIGLGGGSYHLGGEAGPTDSAYLGVFRRDALEAVGGYDESLRRGEDWELNYRLRQAGHLVWFDPALQVTYWPRETWPKLARQFHSTGVWRGELVRRIGASNGIRFFVPPALVVAVALSVLVGLATALVALVATVPTWLAVISALLGLAPAAYLVLLLGAVVTTPGSLGDRLRFAGVVAVMHLAWGTGFLQGVVRGAGTNRDTSRSEGGLTA
ncbi:glycosyltransferase family 2 protein [Agrococcus jejuensis]|uniref:glycosyltransferase family 2 protein n=1 Tax=Agrococcus jejuensis TaxID=399736 RepID=UPI000ABCBFF1|nr:glycosyltransferase family 2 protein [Agrococcus jejuensis]